MPLYRYYPIPGDRMGFLWCATQVSGLAILEYGPMGTTNFATRHMGDAAPIFSTHINNHILTFGETKDLRAAIRELDASQKYQAIVVSLSSSTAITGFDMEGFCMEMEDEISVPLIPLDLSSLGADYTVGMEKAMKLLVERFARPAARKPGTYNILGCCDDEYMIANDLEAIKALLEHAFGMQCRMTYPFATSVEEISRASEAEINVVLRQEALPAAKWLQKKFGTPYLLADCYGMEGTWTLLAQTEELVGRKSQAALPPVPELLPEEFRKKRTLILGSRCSAAALARVLRVELGMEQVEVMCFSRQTGEGGIPPYSESVLEEQMQAGKPEILLGNSVVFDFPQKAPALEIPVLKPVGIVGRSPRLAQPLRTPAGVQALRQIITGRIDVTPATFLNPFR